MVDLTGPYQRFSRCGPPALFTKVFRYDGSWNLVHCRWHKQDAADDGRE